MRNKNNEIQQYIEQLFLAGIPQYDGSFTYCNEIREGMAYDEKMANAGSLAELKQVIRQHRDFKERHVRKVEATFEYFEEKLALYWLLTLKIVLGISE